MEKRKDPRILIIRDLIKKGYKKQEIAKILRITRQRLHQILEGVDKVA